MTTTRPMPTLPPAQTAMLELLVAAGHEGRTLLSITAQTGALPRVAGRTLRRLIDAGHAEFADADGVFRATYDGARAADPDEVPDAPVDVADAAPASSDAADIDVAPLASTEGCSFSPGGAQVLDYLRGVYPEARTLEEIEKATKVVGVRPLNLLHGRGFARPTSPARDEWVATSQEEAVASRAEHPPAGLGGDARATFIATGRSLKDQTAIAVAAREADEAAAPGGGGRTSTRATADDPDRVAGQAGYDEAALGGKPISQKITASEVARIRSAIAERVAVSPPGTTMLEVLGVDEEDLRAYLRTSDRTALTANARQELGVLTAEVKTSPALWPRKVAAAVWGLHATSEQAADTAAA